jgi:hypothetical protein
MYIEDNYGNITSKSFTIAAVPSAVTINSGALLPTLFGGSDGKITISASGGTPPYKFSKDNSTYQSTITLEGFASGTHTVYVKDKNDCVFPFDVPVPAGRKTSISSITCTPPTCHDGSDGKCVIVTGDLEGILSLGGSTAGSVSGSTITYNNYAGTYSTKITETYNGTSYSIDTSFTIPEKAQIEIVQVVSNVTDKGTATGKISVSVSGGNNGTYRVCLLDGKDTLQKTNTGSTCTFSNINGEYNNGGKGYKIVVFDAKGCSKSEEVRVGEPRDTLTITAQLTKKISNYNGSDAVVTVSGSGGWGSYYYSSNGTSWHKESVFKDLSFGTYTYFVKDGNNGTASTSIKIENPLKLDISDTVQPTCELANATLKATALGGTLPYTYELQQVKDGIVVQAKTSNSAVIFYGIASGSYRVAVFDSNGCYVQSGIIPFREYKNPETVNADISDVICFGESNGSITAVPQKWTAVIDHFMLIRGVDTTRSIDGIFSDLSAGNGYTLYAFDINGCSSNSAYPAMVNQPDSLYIDIDTILPVINKGAKSGRIIFSAVGGNNGNITVCLKNVENKTIDSVVTSKGFDNEFSVHAGIYTLQATDSKGCTYISDTLRVDEPTDSLRLVVKEVNNALCKSQTGFIVVEGVGGWGNYKYKRDNSNSFVASDSFAYLYPGTYIITVMDAKGAIASDTVTVYEPDSLRAEVISIYNVNCHGGKLDVELSGGTAPYRLFSDISNDTVFVSTQGAEQYSIYKNGALLLHIIDNNGCKVELETEVNDTNMLVIEGFEIIPATPSKNGGIIAEVKGGAGRISYIWREVETGRVFHDSVQIMDVQEGYYELTVTDEDNCDTSKLVYLHSVSDLILKTVEIGHERSFNAKNGYAVLHVSEKVKNVQLMDPNKNFIDATSSTINDTIYLNSLYGGHWFVKATDTSGWRNAVTEFDIISYEEFKFGKIDLRPVSAPDDTDGYACVEIAGGAGENRYVWIYASGDTGYFGYFGDTISSADYESGTTATNLRAGIYTLFVTDKYSNTISTDIEILAPSQGLQLNISEWKNQNCNEIEDGYVILSAAGGWGDYRYAHCFEVPQDSNTRYSNENIYQDLAAGEHYFYTVDKYGKTVEQKVTITKPDVLRASVAEVENAKCKNDFNGTIEFDISGGNNYYYFKKAGTSIWYKGNMATELPAGNHTFEFTDSLGCVCKDTLTVTITEPEALLLQSMDVTHTTCSEDNGKIIISLTGGTRPYHYLWMDGENNIVGCNSVIVNLKQSTQYQLLVADSHGCSGGLEQFIQSSQKPQITNVDITNVLCYGNSTGAAHITTVEAGIPYAPYSFIWSNGSVDSVAESLIAGEYSVTVEDTNGCNTTYYLEVTQPDSLYLLITESKNPQCFDYSDGWIKTETHGGTGAYTYLWSNGETASNISNLKKGDYQVRVTDGNGCYYDNGITLTEPDYQSVYLGADVVICPGSTHVVDGGDYKSYRWYTDSNDNIYAERYLKATEGAHYYLEAKDENDCSAWGDIEVTTGNSALKADMLLPSEAELGDTIYVIEISNLSVDRIDWLYDSTAFAYLDTDTTDIYSKSHILPLQCKETGVYTISVEAYSGNCYSPISKEIEIVERQDTAEVEVWGISPLIKNAGVYPNPTNGNFTVQIILREDAEVNLKLFDLTYGKMVNEHTERGQSTYNINYSRNNLHKGAYILTLTADKEHRQIKIIVQ